MGRAYHRRRRLYLPQQPTLEAAGSPTPLATMFFQRKKFQELTFCHLMAFTNFRAKISFGGFPLILTEKRSVLQRFAIDRLVFLPSGLGQSFQILALTVVLLAQVCRRHIKVHDHKPKLLLDFGQYSLFM